jgi:hypothetical protein
MTQHPAESDNLKAEVNNLFFVNCHGAAFRKPFNPLFHTRMNVDLKKGTLNWTIGPLGYLKLKK